MKKPVEEEVSSDVLEICTADLEKLVSTASTTQGTSLYETWDGHVTPSRDMTSLRSAAIGSSVV